MQPDKLKLQNASRALAQLLPTDVASHDNLKSLLARWQERYNQTSPAGHTRK